LNAIDVTAVPAAAVEQPEAALQRPQALKEWEAVEHTNGRTSRRQTRSGPRIAGLTLSDSEQTVTQRQVLDRLGLSGDEFAERIFAHSRIERRHLNLAGDFLCRTSQGRAREVEDELLRHSVRAVDRLSLSHEGDRPRRASTTDGLPHRSIEAESEPGSTSNGRPHSPLDASRIGSVISSSLYTLGLPTLAHRLAEHYGLDPATDKYHVTGVGCASAVPLMRMALGALHQHPGRDSLIVAAESMSSIMMPGSSEDPRAKTVGSAIFGDGCAAALLSSDPGAGGPAIVASTVHQIGGTLDAVALSFAAEDSYLHLARELPDLAGAGLPGVVGRFLRENDLERADVDHWIVHPGGRRIIENIQSALELSDEQIELSWDTLANHGNVGTPSIFYVLHDTLVRRDPQPGERGLAVTIGPGVTVGLMLLQW
jgi:alkylresorcinol/alkylpyrone synthase